jgi:dihydroneopterin aldolase
MDRIVIPGIPLRAHVGVTEAERASEQGIVVEVELGLDLRAAGTSDDLARTVDYEAACDAVAAAATTRPHRLIESIAEECAGALLARFSTVDEVRVRVRKPAALRSRDVPFAAVEVLRRRG